MDTACCTCARLLADVSAIYDEKTEKLAVHDRRLDCCGRVICGSCIYENARFGTYCPFCQISLKPTSLPQGLKDPPSYSTLSPSSHPTNPPANETLPPYTPSSTSIAPEKSQPAEDVLHFLDHKTDTLASLSFRYNVPLPVLRRANGLSAETEYLLGARRTVVVPGSHYKGESLSARPVEGEEEEWRRGKVRKWMVACKVSEYDVALLYLKQVDYDLDAATQAYKDDERWEKEHPIDTNVKGKGKRHEVGSVGRRRFTGQRS